MARIPKNTMYKITITKWDDHNRTSKKSYKHVKIATNFCTDSKLSALPIAWRWLFLGLLLECGNNGRGSVEISERHIRALTETSSSTDRVLDALQSLRVLTWEYVSPNKVINKEIKEHKKTKPRKSASTDVEPPQAELNLSEQPKPPRANEIIVEYVERYREKYGTAPVITPKDAGIAKRISKAVGSKAKEFIRGYLSMDDPWFKTKSHDLATLESNLNKIQNSISGVKRHDERGTDYYIDPVARIVAD